MAKKPSVNALLETMTADERAEACSQDISETLKRYGCYMATQVTMSGENMVSKIMVWPEEAGEDDGVTR